LVSAIIPARDEEASIARAVASVAAQPEVSEIIVVNDQSTDHTAAVLSELAAHIPKLKILSAGKLPAGWVGKNYAASLGAAAARGDWLLFTDADTFHLPGSTRRALADAADHDASLVSYSPEQDLGTFWERALVPVVYCRLATRFSYARVNDPRRSDAAANGQFLMISREVYQAIRGHAGVAGEILEDVALARRVKEAGHRIYFTASKGTVRTRMYRSFRAMWQGWTKNLYPLMCGSLKSLLWELSPFLFLAIFLMVEGSSGLTHDRAIFWGCCGAALAMIHVSYGLALHKNLYPLFYIAYMVPGVCLYAVVLTASWWKNTRGVVVWKGREYQGRVQPRTP
jgi:glycosyltransferase involved in cell wall biosynthesis